MLYKSWHNSSIIRGFSQQRYVVKLRFTRAHAALVPRVHSSTASNSSCSESEGPKSSGGLEQAQQDHPSDPNSICTSIISYTLYEAFLVCLIIVQNSSINTTLFEHKSSLSLY